MKRHPHASPPLPLLRAGDAHFALSCKFLRFFPAGFRDATYSTRHEQSTHLQQPGDIFALRVRPRSFLSGMTC